MDEGEFLRDALTRLGLWTEPVVPGYERLTGGVASDIWRVDLPAGPVCIKRALPKLRVATDWRAPVARNAFEVAWMRTARAIEPGSAPRIIAHDAEAGLFAMPYLPPDRYRLWKRELRDGRVEVSFAAEVGRRLGHIHAATAGDPTVAARFRTDAIFHAIRVEPYLEATAARHPDLRDALYGIAQRIMAHKLALVHGDVSPKNILAGPDGPVFLDAECAWYGDPVFDIAFCLNHMLLKCLWTPSSSAGFLACFDAMAASWLQEVDWEPPTGAERRAATLLPGLFLGRVDGRSPVEYLETESDRDRVRRVAGALLRSPPGTLAEVRRAWQKELDL